MTVLQFVCIPRMFKYNILSMFKKGFINFGNVKNMATQKNYTQISERILRKVTKIMFLEDINAAK